MEMGSADLPEVLLAEACLWPAAQSVFRAQCVVQPAWIQVSSSVQALALV